MVEVVWLNDYNRFGFLKVRNFTHSLVAYQVDGGKWVSEWLENNDYEIFEERATEYESE